MNSINNKCILCLDPILSQTKPEHILLNALGGRSVVRGIICSECNGAMGRGPDHDLAASVAMLRNIGNLRAGDGGAPPIIHGLTGEGITFDLAPGMQAKPRHEGKKLNVRRTADEIEISISATSERELDTLMRSAARAIAKDLETSDPRVIEAIYADLIRDHNRSDTIAPAPAIRDHFQFGANQSQQSMAKSALVLWARLVGNDEVCQTRYDRIRNFIWRGEKPPNPEDLAKLDCRPLPDTPEQFGTNPNIIQVISGSDGAAYGYFRLYGAIGWRFLLCSSGAPPNRACSLISNPFQNHIFQICKGSNATLPSSWILTDWQNDLTQMKPVLDRLRLQMAYSQNSYERKMISNWIQEALYLRDRKEGDHLSESDMVFVSEYISNRLLVYLTRTKIKL